MSGIRVFNAAMSAYKKSRQDYQATQVAKEKLKRDKASFDIKMKKDKLDLEAARQSGRMTDIGMEALEYDHKKYKKQKEDEYNVYKTKVSEAEQRTLDSTKTNGAMVGAILGARIKENQSQGAISQPQRNQTQRNLQPVWSNGKFYYKQKEQTKPKVTNPDKIMGNLAVGGMQEKDGFTEFVGRREAERYATMNLGQGWKRKFPKAAQIMDAKYGPNVNDLMRELRSQGIETARVARNYVVEKYGMSLEDAHNYIKENLPKGK